MVFEYSGLNKHKPEIRLLKVEHCLDAKLPLRVRLNIVDLDSNPVYTALSYTWGDEQPSYDIQVMHEAHGKNAAFRVRHNLHAFLRMVRTNTIFRGEETFFWIDQICINQSDLSEKTHQVQQMDRVYRQAAQVHIWLGDEVKNHGRIGEAERFGAITEKYMSDAWMGNFTMTRAVKNLLRSLVDSITSIMMARYWTRVWILQEISLAQDCRIWLGPHKIKWPMFIEDTMNIFAIGSNTNIGLSRNTIDRSAELLLHKIARVEDKLTWSDSAFVIEKYGCSVPVDKFYSLLSLVHPSVRVVPDYTKSPKEVLFEVVKKEVAFMQSVTTEDLEERSPESEEGAVRNIMVAAYDYRAILHLMAVTLRWWRQTGDVDNLDRAELQDFLRREVFGRYRSDLEYSERRSLPSIVDEAVL